MNSNKTKIKFFLLEQKKSFQELLSKNITADCYRCPMQMHELNDMIPNYHNCNCSKAYEHIAILLNKEPKKSVIRTDVYCKDIYKEMISLASFISN